MDTESDQEELEPRVKYSFIVQEEDYEEEGESGSDSDTGDEETLLKSDVQPWDPSDIFFRIK
jgi:hypothetical protein